MNKNAMNFTLIQNFLSETELQANLVEFNYVETARKCTGSTLLKYLLGTAIKEWKSLRHAADGTMFTGGMLMLASTWLPISRRKQV